MLSKKFNIQLIKNTFRDWCHISTNQMIIRISLYYNLKWLIYNIRKNSRYMIYVKTIKCKGQAK